MSKKDKLLERLQSKPKDFTMGDVDSLIGMCGCKKNNRGQISGSGIKYIGKDSKNEFRFHRPHPGNELPSYVLVMAIEFLKNEGEIK